MLISLLLSPLLVAVQSQSFFSSENAYDAKLFTPVESLSALTEDAFTMLSHPMFPNYNVRIKKSRFCDTTVNAYTGYIDILARHLFFYFFESRSNPDTDDVILWTNGGPGCSSSLGLFMEHGPCRMLNTTEPTFHNESWNTNANIFYIDQPIGVGFSYAEFGESVSTTEEAAKDVATFVTIFFENFTQFKGRAFHMAAESYGGRYLPLFASAVYDQNTKLIAAGMTPVNLTSVMIGNGMTDAVTMYLSYYDVQCTPVIIDPVLDIATCVGIKNILPRCERWLKQSCVDTFEVVDCTAAYTFCAPAISGAFDATNLNMYDMTKKCEGDRLDTFCYPETLSIRAYLSDPKVRKTLGVDTAFLPPKFVSCNNDVLAVAFGNNLDFTRLTKEYVAALLERGVRVLIYVGVNDWLCNHVGNERWTLDLEWSGQREFAGAEKREWKVDGKRAGVARRAGPFTFATIDGGGHMAPYDKPKESLVMLQRWLADEGL